MVQGMGQCLCKRGIVEEMGLSQDAAGSWGVIMALSFKQVPITGFDGRARDARTCGHEAQMLTGVHRETAVDTVQYVLTRNRQPVQARGL